MKITVITVCYNAERFIERAILSVLNQSYPEIEYVVVDGDSTDGTHGILNKFSEEITHLLIEPDNGIYDAMNKGINLATGDFIFFLNADDFFIHENVIQVAVNAMGHSVADLYFGDLLILDQESGKVECLDQSGIDKFGVIKEFPKMPATFYRKSAFEKAGYFSLSYKIVSDYYWMLGAILHSNLRMHYLDAAFVVFQTGGVSTSELLIQKQKEEKNLARAEFLSGINWRIYKKLIKLRCRFPMFNGVFTKLGVAIVRLPQGSFDSQI